jgi:hypothetical protein
MESRLEVKGNVYKEIGPVVITHDAADAVVAATRTWTFTNAAFTTSYEGKIITIAGAANAGNNGKFVIHTVTSPTTVITDERGVLTNETFGAGVSQSVNIDPCWAIQAAATQIQITFADGTILQTNGTNAETLLNNVKLIVKQAEVKGVTTGGAHEWTFSVKGTSCFQTPEDQP